MKMITNSLILNKTKLKKDLVQYNNCKKNKISITSIVLFVLFIILLIVGMVLTFKIQSYYIIIIIVSFVCATASAFFYRRIDNINKVTYIKNLELNHNNYAIKNNILSLHPVFPLFLKTIDKDELFAIYYMDKIVIECKYSDIKNYKIFYNGSYETKQRLPKTPLKGIKRYSIQIIFTNGEEALIELINYYAPFMLNSKIDYLQFVNTKMINDLATILDQVLRVNKKNKIKQ